METLYDILEVSRKASKEIIEKAYRTLAKKYHPDLQTAENRSYAEEKMKKINEAYDILSDEEKRSEYDRKLEEQEYKEQQRYQHEQQQTRNDNVDNINYYNINQNNMYNQQQNINTETNADKENDWRTQFANLSKKEQRKVIKNIQKEANEEYRKQYENYFRNLGFRIKHKWTFKDLVSIGILLLVLTVIFFILWLIPATHEWLVKLYEENFLIKILIDIVRGVFQGIIEFFQNIPKF